MGNKIRKGKEENLSLVLKTEESRMKIVKTGGIRKVIRNDMNLFNERKCPICK